MSKMSNLQILESEQNDSFVDDSDADEWIAIEKKRKAMSDRRGYQVDFHEAKTHYLFDLIDERIAEINSIGKGLPRDIGFAGEDHPDQGDFYHG